MRPRNKNKNAPVFSKEAWRYFIQFFADSKYKLIGTSIGFTIQAFLIIPVLLLVKYIFDQAIPDKNINMLIIIGLSILGIRLINTGFTLFLRQINIKIISSVVFKIRENLVYKIYTFSRAFYSREDQRELHTQIVQDTERIMRMSNSLISSLVPSILIGVGLCVVLFSFNWLLFIIMLLFFPVIFFSNRYMGKIVKKKVYSYQRAFEGFSKGTMYLMKFMELIKIQSAETMESQKQIDVLENLKDKTTSRVYFLSANNLAQAFLVGITGVIVMVVGGISVIQGLMTLGDLFAFYIAANHLQRNINSINNSYANIITGNESLVTLYNIVSNDDTEPYSGKSIIEFKGNIQLQKVCFAYSDLPVIDEISLQIKAGNKLALIGANGAGKSTIINLILGFYKPQTGNIWAENTSYEDIDFHSFRKSIGVVSQHLLLIPGTIHENIMYGNENAAEEDVIKVSKLSMAHEFVELLPAKYNTSIGENGILLSGGERQKIAIARALLRKPSFLVLDEPTNHLDKKAITTIMKNLENIEYNPSILIISHDMTVVDYAQDIFLLENGKLQKWDKNKLGI